MSTFEFCIIPGYFRQKVEFEGKVTSLRLHLKIVCHQRADHSDVSRYLLIDQVLWPELIRCSPIIALYGFFSLKTSLGRRLLKKSHETTVLHQNSPAKRPRQSECDLCDSYSAAHGADFAT